MSGPSCSDVSPEFISKATFRELSRVATFRRFSLSCRLQSARATTFRSAEGEMEIKLPITWTITLLPRDPRVVER